MYAITGHTRGIGKAIHDELSPECIGFSKSTGFDIEQIEDRKAIIQSLFDREVFINCAHSGFGQAELLIDLVRHWQNRNKLIINIGSQAAHVTIPPNKQNLLIYAAEKAALKNVVDNCQEYQCRVEYLNWGYVGTQRILKKYPNLTEYKTIPECVSEVNDLIEKWESNNEPAASYG